MKEVLIVFQKNPELGKVKTRLAKDIGDAEALDVYKRLIRYTKAIIDPLHVEKQIWYSGWLEENDVWEISSYRKFIQSGGDLGERMEHAFDQALGDRGDSRVCIIGTDCGELSAEIVKQAFDALNHHDFVVGPTSDGGYYLLGMSSRAPELFQNIAWSTSEVRKSTIQKIEELNKTFHLLPMLNDVDTHADWKKIKDRISGY